MNEWYSPPKWANAPKSEWSLDEIKGGVVVGSYNLDSACCTFGRAAEVKGTKSILTAHESCSRLHARLAFDKSGIPWLKDLQSGNGSTVNKQKLPPQSIGRSEHDDDDDNANNPPNAKEGSRGVIVHPGDVLQFGCSTRIFVLNGPPSFERSATRAAPPSAPPNGPSAAEEAGISWGIHYNDDQPPPPPATHEGASEESSLHSLFETDPAVSSKHRAQYERIRSKRYKLDNIRTETERISAKAHTGELSAGQEAQMQKNAEREEALEREIEAMEQDLCGKVRASRAALAGVLRRPGKKRRRESSRHAPEDDVDDFYDKTASSRNRPRTDKAETEESLTSGWKASLSKLALHDRKLNLARTQLAQVQQEIAQQDDPRATADHDSFFLRNDLKLAQDHLNGLFKTRTAINKELDSIEHLFSIVNHNLRWDRRLRFVGNQQQFEALTKQHHTAENTPPTVPPTPVAKPNIHNNPSDDKHNTAKEETDKMPPPPCIPPPKHTKQSEQPLPSIQSTDSKSKPRIDLDMPPPAFIIPPPKQQQLHQLSNPVNHSTTTNTPSTEQNSGRPTMGPPPTQQRNISSTPSPTTTTSHPRGIHNTHGGSPQSNAKRPNGTITTTNTTTTTQNHRNDNMPPPAFIIPSSKRRRLGPTMPPPPSSSTPTDTRIPTTHHTSPTPTIPTKTKHTRTEDDMVSPKDIRPKAEVMGSKSSSGGGCRSMGAPPPPPLGGTLSAAALLLASSSPHQGRRNNNDRSKMSRSRGREGVIDPKKFDSRKDEWVVPEGQDGSGITKLNAKFHGRY